MTSVIRHQICPIQIQVAALKFVSQDPETEKVSTSKQVRPYDHLAVFKLNGFKVYYTMLTEFAIKGLLTRATNATILKLKTRLLRSNVQYSREKVHEMLMPILHEIVQHGQSLEIALLAAEGYFLSTPNFLKITEIYSETLHNFLMIC